ncbi:MAG: hypothetical protein ACO1O6_05995 [Bacteroidota bacterium]
MKKIILFAFLLILVWPVTAQTVKLKITYKDYPVTDSDITIKLGDAALGKGRTDNDGNVSIMCSNLISKSIDVYGSKQTSNSTKTWDVKGYVNLDENNFYHLKMEVIAKEMADMSGMSESMIASMWGLSASGRNDAPNPNSASSSNAGTNTNSGGNTTSAASDSNTEDEIPDLTQMREENLVAYRQNLENDIIRYERKIKRAEQDISEAKASGKPQGEIRRWEIDRGIDILVKEKKEIQLRETNAKIAKSELPFEERKRNEIRKEEIKSEISRLKEEDKKLKKENAAGEEARETEKDKQKYSEESIAKKNKLTLKAELTELKMDLKRKNLNYKIQSGSGQSDEKLAELKREITAIETIIPRYERRLAELEKQEE